MQRTLRIAEKIKLCETLRSPRLCVGKFTQENKIFTDNYPGGAVVHWTMPMTLRGTGWLNEAFPPDFER